MKYFKFAVRVERHTADREGRRWHQTLIGVSNESEADARRNGEARLAELPLPQQPRSVARQTPDHYTQYGNRPVVEELVKELHDDRQQLAGILTRNHYGSVILNAAQVPFFDVDVSPSSSKPSHSEGPSLWRWLFGQSVGSHSSSKPSTELELLQATLRQYSDLIFRVYQTAAGYRIMLLNRMLEPNDSLTQRLFADLGCDPLYRRLCGSQECFRARLTPKPWRCGLSAPVSTYPRSSIWSQDSFQAWLIRYEGTIRDYAVCRWVGDVGGSYQASDLPSSVQLLLSIHDAFTLRDSELPLA
jgi:hypothetical protein